MASLLHVSILTSFLLGSFTCKASARSEQTVLSSSSLVIDTFNSTTVNALGFYHGVSGEASIGDFEEINGGNYLKVTTGDIDASFSTSLAEGCTDLTPFLDRYIHIQVNGSSKFTISLQQHNDDCNDTILPFPLTWDSVKAARYTTENNSDIYVPIAHFNVSLQRVNGIALENWYTNDTTYVYKIELVEASAVPGSVKTVSKLNTGTLHTGCVDPNSIAFGIDDGDPAYLQQTLQIIKDEGIPVTFFIQGSALQLSIDDGNFTDGYNEMYALGHQLGLHTMTHPHMENVTTEEAIELEIARNIEVVKQKLNVTSNYFRPPFGTIGSRTRQALARQINDAQVIMWSIDVRDWVFGEDDTLKRQKLQYKAFQDSLDLGGTIVVMHYLYSSTVDQFRDMIQYARNRGRQFVRMDQCICDPAAPQTWDWKRQMSCAKD